MWILFVCIHEKFNVENCFGSSNLILFEWVGLILITAGSNQFRIEFRFLQVGLKLTWFFKRKPKISFKIKNSMHEYEWVFKYLVFYIKYKTDIREMILDFSFKTIFKCRSIFFDFRYQGTSGLGCVRVGVFRDWVGLRLKYSGIGSCFCWSISFLDRVSGWLEKI